jgi:hypothetical protein
MRVIGRRDAKVAHALIPGRAEIERVGDGVS